MYDIIKIKVLFYFFFTAVRPVTPLGAKKSRENVRQHLMMLLHLNISVIIQSSIMTKNYYFQNNNISTLIQLNLYFMFSTDTFVFFSLSANTMYG